MKLKDVKIGATCFVAETHGTGSLYHRLQEFGFVKGKQIKVIKQAPMGSPIEYEVMGSRISLRKEEAGMINVTTDANPSFSRTNPKENADFLQRGAMEVKKEKGGATNTFRVTLVGNPNCGKTSLFNYATGLRKKVGNYAGVTVEKTSAIVNYKGCTIEFIDLPGTYSLSNITSEERFVYEHLKTGSTDIVINIIDASNLERNLLLTTQLLQQDFPVIIALNMIDELEKSGAKLNIEELRTRLDVPILPTFASKGRGIKELLDCIVELAKVYSTSTTKKGNLPSEAESRKPIQQKVEDTFSFIQKTLSGIYTAGENVHKKSSRIDKWLTHKWLGIPILLLSLWFMFEATFTIGAYPQAWIENGIAMLNLWITEMMPSGILSDFITNGVISGVGGVIVFLPQILILFFFISLFEDTGYMARMAFMMDKTMSSIGLNGKSFIPFLIGFGCGVPAIMATRTLGSRSDRLITMLTIPFMSCSARLPVYLLFTAAFFSSNKGLILLSIYMIGLLVAVITALLLRHTLLRGEKSELVMELPPYRWPTLRNASAEMWQKSAVYLRKMGSIILVASIVVWALGSFPQSGENEEIRLENSYIGQLGKTIEPVMKPLGFDWKMGVSIITGLGAKEIVVSTMGILYGAGDEADESSQPLIKSLQSKTNILPITAYAFMIFILLYFPCIAVISAIRYEAGILWAGAAMVYTTLVAWLIAFGITNFEKIVS
ncbi:MAG: ferrous iron transport protein B [Bacteroidaceae bacterium]